MLLPITDILQRPGATAPRENEVYILLLLIVLVASALAVRSFLYWTFPEAPEDDRRETEPPAHAPFFFDPRTWAMFQPKLLISYRRDKKGRFRKMP